jgi:5'-nucleotidase
MVKYNPNQGIITSMHILISNDDGVNAEGLRVLVEELSSIAKITVVAPDRDRSGASNSLTLAVPIRCQTLPNGFISVAGTPTDCIHTALTSPDFLEKKPDFVVSGINEGANMGDDVMYSGTVAAATEGRILGIPAIAISLAALNERNFKTAAIMVRQLIEKMREEPLPAGTILSVNVPDLPLKEIRGFEVTRLGTRHCAAPTLATTDPRGNRVYWVGPPGAEEDAGPGTDFYAVRSGFVSITPLMVDRTNYKAFDQLGKWTAGLAA